MLNIPVNWVDHAAIAPRKMSESNIIRFLSWFYFLSIFPFITSAALLFQVWNELINKVIEKSSKSK